MKGHFCLFGGVGIDGVDVGTCTADECARLAGGQRGREQPAFKF